MSSHAHSHRRPRAGWLPHLTSRSRCSGSARAAAEPRLHFSRLEGARRMNPRLVRLFIAAATCGCGNNSISGAGGPEGLESIAFASCDAGGVSQITLSMPDGSHQRMVTNTSSPSWFPAWSPDGARLMFTREVADAGGGRVPQLWVMNADGTRARALVTSGISMAGSWSSDGQRIAYHHRPSLQEGARSGSRATTAARRAS